jgi:hypothetical protein
VKGSDVEVPFLILSPESDENPEPFTEAAHLHPEDGGSRLLRNIIVSLQ